MNAEIRKTFGEPPNWRTPNASQNAVKNAMRKQGVPEIFITPPKANAPQNSQPVKTSAPSQPLKVYKIPKTFKCNTKGFEIKFVINNGTNIPGIEGGVYLANGKLPNETRYDALVVSDDDIDIATQYAPKIFKLWYDAGIKYGYSHIPDKLGPKLQDLQNIQTFFVLVKPDASINDKEKAIKKLQKFLTSFLQVNISKDEDSLKFNTLTALRTNKMRVLQLPVDSVVYTAEGETPFTDLKQTGGRKATKSSTKTTKTTKSTKTPKIHTGPNGGKYYIKSGKKVYVK